MSDRTEHLTDTELDDMVVELFRTLRYVRQDLAQRIRVGEPVNTYSDESIARLRVAIAAADARGEDVSDDEWSAILLDDAKILGSPQYAQILAQIDQLEARQ